ncbi:UDP-glucose 4-epimerase GalE [Alphaproteobacteria bacterium]|nr:UDP-glucose 4-epimerase GalE [Alphaproteobacteria bacterium]
MNILLTGGAGYIGSHVLLLLKDKNHKVTVIDNLSTGNKNLIPSHVNHINCNIEDSEKITNIIKDKNFDLLLHFAGFIKVEESVEYPDKYFENNTENAIKLFKTCYKHNLKNIIFSSTAAAYGNPSNNESITENEILNPLNPYGESKVKTEEYLLNNKDKYNSIILRYFNVAGADPELRSGLISDTPTHLIKILSEVAVGKRKKISIFGNDYNTKDGTAIRDYIHVSDLASIHLEAAKYLLDNKISNIFNCGYGKGYSVLEVINTANEIYNNKIKFEYDKRRPGDSEKLISNVDKLHQHMNWKPKFDDLKLIIKTAVEWEKKIDEKNL